MLENSLRVLVVDDEPVMTFIMATFLKRFGHIVQATNDSREALSLARDFKPEVVLLDINMPHLDGYKVAGLLRHEPDLQSTPIICVSALDHDEHKSRAAAGINRQLVKPCNFDQLKTLLAEVTTG
jgi:two-component system response regulator AdeR